MGKRQLITRSEFARLAGVQPASVTKACNKVLKPACVGSKIDPDHEAAVAYIEKKEFERTVPATGFDPAYELVAAKCSEAKRYSKTFIQKEFGFSWERITRIYNMLSAAGIIPKKGEPPPVIERTPEPPVEPRIIKGHTKRNHNKKSQALADLSNGSTLHEVPADIEKFADMTLREIIQRYGSDTAFVDWLKASKLIEDINEKRLKNAETKGKLVNRELVKRGIIEPIDGAFTGLLTDGSKAMSVRVTAIIKSGEPVEEVEAYIKEQISSFIRPVKSKIKKMMRNDGN